MHLAMRGHHSLRSFLYVGKRSPTISYSFGRIIGFASCTDAQLERVQSYYSRANSATYSTSTSKEGQSSDQEIKQLLQPHVRHAWTPSRFGLLSRFGGVPSLRKGDVQPTCGECKEKLSFYLQLEVECLPEPIRQKFGGEGLLQLFACTHGCELHHPTTALCQLRHDRLYLKPEVSYGQTFAEFPVTGWNCVEDYPSEGELRDNHAELIDKLGEVDPEWPWLCESICDDKIGGYPVCCQLTLCRPRMVGL